MLSFDHVSLVGPREALAGLCLTPTDGDPRHARAHLGGSYLELRITGSPAPLRGVGWFLRPDDPVTIVPSLARIGVQASTPTIYRGADGSWSDISLGSGPHGPVVPGVTHRLDRPDWPPAAGGAHPNGVAAVAGLELATPDPPALARLLTQLGAVTAPDPPDEVAASSLLLGALRVTLVSAPQPGLRALTLRRHRGPPARLPLGS